jgi:hypothetical protein
VSASGAFLNIRGDSILWTMEESLTETVGALVYDHPEHIAATLDADELGFDVSSQGIDQLLSRYIARWQKHLGQLLHFVGNLNLNYFTQSSSDADRYGFRKLFVFVSKKGNVIAMESTTGKTIWQRFLGIKAKKTFETKSFRNGDPLFTIYGQQDGKSVLVTLNALTGSFYEHKKGDKGYTVLDNQYPLILPTIFETKKHIQQLALISTENVVKLFPPSVEQAAGQFLRWWTVKTGKSPGVTGYQVKLESDNENAGDQVWNIHFLPGEVVEDWIQVDTKQVASLGRVLGDRSVLYKYLNPNLLVLATKNIEEQKIVVYIIDTVVGSILDRIVHHHVGGDLKLIARENFVAYSYLNFGKSAIGTDEGAKSKPGVNSIHNELTVLELFESNKPDQRHDRFLLLI